jgi:hypothetical protein
MPGHVLGAAAQACEPRTRAASAPGRQPPVRRRGRGASPGAGRGHQRQRPQNLTSASGDAIWGAHRPNYIHGQFGGFFLAPQVPPRPPGAPPWPVVISTKLTSRLSLAPCCAGQPSFGHIQAAPRRALLSLESIRRRPSQAKITGLSTVRSAGLP